MKRAAWLGVCGLCVSLTVACGGQSDDARENEQDDDFTVAGTSPVTETGCLTSSGDRYALTSLESAEDAGRPTTELYRLIGNDEDLRGLVGRQVRVTGIAEPAQVAQVIEQSGAAGGAVGTTGPERGTATRESAEPQVTTTAETRIETRQLRVSTVAATGDACVASATSEAATEPAR